VASITEVPVTIFAKGASFAFPDMNKVMCRTIGLDWTNDPIEASKLLPGKTLQGNLDPCALYSSPAQLKIETEKMMFKFKGIPHIANLGHGVYPDTNPDNVKIFIDTVKNYKND
jgi:uroporphyrinogen decarboxylase